MKGSQTHFVTKSRCVRLLERGEHNPASKQSTGEFGCLRPPGIPAVQHSCTRDVLCRLSWYWLGYNNIPKNTPISESKNEGQSPSVLADQLLACRSMSSNFAVLHFSSGTSSIFNVWAALSQQRNLQERHKAGSKLGIIFFER